MSSKTKLLSSLWALTQGEYILVGLYDTPGSLNAAIAHLEEHGYATYSVVDVPVGALPKVLRSVHVSTGDREDSKPVLISLTELAVAYGGRRG